MGIFYNPPQPPIGTNAATPPEPHIPITAQGNQPPRYSTAVMLVAVLASWPLDLEPRLTAPNNQQQHIAPLTLPRGDAPPILGASAIVESTIIGTWPADLEPRLQVPNNVRQTIAPLTLPYGQQPATIGTSIASEYALVVGQWPADLEPRLGSPNNARVSMAPLTLAYGSQSTPTAPLNAPAFQAISTWPQPDWPAQSAPKSTAWTVLPTTAPFVPFPYGVVLASWPADLEPRLTRPNDQPQKIAPLTLPTGTQPTPQAPLSVSTLTATVGTWPTTWDAQTAPKNAAWNVPPILVQVPSAPLPRLIWTAWEPPWISPPPLVAIAPLTLPTGQQPPPIPSTALRSIYAWPIDPALVQRASNVAAVIPPIVAQVPYTAPPALLWTAWVEPFVRPPALVAIAPVTLPTGQAPPLITTARVTLAVLLGANWPPDLEPRLGLPNTVRQTIAPLTLVYGALPPRRPPLAASPASNLALLVSAWTQDWSAQTASKDFLPSGPPPVSGPQRVRVFGHGLRQAAAVGEQTTAATLRQPATVSPYAEAIIGDGPIAYWRLDDVGPTFRDVIASSDGTGSGPYAAQQVGALADGDTAVRFTQSIASQITIAATSALAVLNTARQLTQEVWFQIDPTLAPSVTTIYNLLTWPAGASALQTKLLFFDAATAAPHPAHWTLEVDTTGNEVDSDDALGAALVSLVPGVWYHAVSVLDLDALTNRLYVNGVFVKASTLVISVTLNMGGGLSIGGPANASGDGSLAWTGSVDDVAIYARTLTATQIAAHYALRTATTRLQAGLVTPRVINEWMDG